MRLFKFIVLAAILIGLPLAGFSAEQADPAATAQSLHPDPATHAESHGLPLNPVAIGHVPGTQIPITNSMVVTWIVALFLILFAQFATRQVKDVPTGAQNFWEWLVESLYTFLENIIGHDLVKKTFWFFATIFIFILFSNWFGLIPGVGTMGWGHQGAHGFVLD